MVTVHEAFKRKVTNDITIYSEKLEQVKEFVYGASSLTSMVDTS